MVTFAHPIEQKIFEACAQGTPCSVEALGGWEELLANSQILANLPVLPLLFHSISASLLNASEAERKLAFPLIISLLTNSTVDIAFVDSVEILLASPALHDGIEEQLCAIFDQKSRDTSLGELIRSVAIEALLQWSLTTRRPQIRLLDNLLGISVDDSPYFLAHAVKVIGFAYAYLNEPELLEKIRQLLNVSEAESGAAFECGMSYLRMGLEGNTIEACLASFQAASKWFEHSATAIEVNPQACIYKHSLDILCKFYENRSSCDISPYLDKLKLALFEYEYWTKRQSAALWMGARNTEILSWNRLSNTLINLADKLGEPSWIEPILIIETYLLTAYSANKTIFSIAATDGGPQLLIRPRIESAVINPGLLHHLEQWLQAKRGESGYEIASLLMEKAQFLSGNTNSFSESPLVCNALRNAFEYAVATQSNTTKQMIERVLQQLCEHCDYASAKTVFDAIIVNVIKFIENRSNATKGNDPNIEYLFENSSGKKALEKQLQDDLYRWLYSTCNGFMEIPNIGSGRVDILFFHENERIVMEIKREILDASFDNLEKKYATQTIAYQTTSLRIGFLAVLDLTLGPNSPPPHFSTLLDVREILLKDEELPRVVIIFKIPGMRKRPSDYSH